jgi:hypothetical protein
LRIDAEKSLRRTRRKGEFIRIFYDYSCTFASIRGQFENAEEEYPQGEEFLRNAARTLRARAPVMLLAAHSVVRALSENAFFSLKARLRPPVAPLPRTLLFNTDEEDGTDGKVRGKEYVGSVCA